MRKIDKELLNACWIGDLEKVKQLLEEEIKKLENGGQL